MGRGRLADVLAVVGGRLASYTPCWVSAIGGGYDVEYVVHDDRGNPKIKTDHIPRKHVGSLRYYR